MERKNSRFGFEAIKDIAKISNFKIAFSCIVLDTLAVGLLEKFCNNIEFTPKIDDEKKKHISFWVDKDFKILNHIEQLITLKYPITISVTLGSLTYTQEIEFVAIESIPLINDKSDNPMYINVEYKILKNLKNSQFKLVETNFLKELKFNTLSDFARPNLFYCTLRKNLETKQESELMDKLKFCIKEITYCSDYLSNEMYSFKVMSDENLDFLNFFESNVSKELELTVNILNRQMNVIKTKTCRILIRHINNFELAWEKTDSILEFVVTFSGC